MPNNAKEKLMRFRSCFDNQKAVQIYQDHIPLEYILNKSL